MTHLSEWMTTSIFEANFGDVIILYSVWYIGRLILEWNH